MNTTPLETFAMKIGWTEAEGISAQHWIEDHLIFTRRELHHLRNINPAHITQYCENMGYESFAIERDAKLKEIRDMELTLCNFGEKV